MVWPRRDVVVDGFEDDGGAAVEVGFNSSDRARDWTLLSLLCVNPAWATGATSDALGGIGGVRRKRIDGGRAFDVQKEVLSSRRP